jgi:hypothetical protein
MDKIEQKFIGVWELDEWVVEKPNGDKTFPFSGNVDGFLIYHSEGWMSATLMQKNRTDVSNDRSKIAKISHLFKNDDEVSLEGDLLNTTKNYFLAANGYVSYAGEFNADDINVYHNIKTSLLPQWVGTTLIRRHEFTLKNKSLTLSAESSGFKDFLVWKKV